MLLYDDAPSQMGARTLPRSSAAGSQKARSADIDQGGTFMHALTRRKLVLAGSIALAAPFVARPARAAGKPTGSACWET